MTKIPTREAFREQLKTLIKHARTLEAEDTGWQEPVSEQEEVENDCRLLLAAYDEMIERIVELEAQCDTMGTALLGRGCDGVVHECAVLEARIAALEAVCDSAMDALANGDLVGVHRHLLPVWSRDRG